MSKEESTLSYLYKFDSKQTLICYILILLNTITIFRAGFLGNILFKLYSQLFGDAALFIIVYFIFILILILLRKFNKAWTTKYGRIILLSLITIFIYDSKQYYTELSTTVDFETFNFNSQMELFDVQIAGCGVTGFLIVYNLIKLIGFLGVNIILVSLIVAIFFHLFSYEKIVEYVNSLRNISLFDNEEEYENEADEIENTEEVIEDVIIEKKEKKSLFDNEWFNKSKSKSEEEKQEIDPLFGNIVYSPNEEIVAEKVFVNEDPLFPNNVVFETIEKKESIENEIPIYMEKKEIVELEKSPKKIKINSSSYSLPPIDLLKDYGDNSQRLKKLKKIALEKSEALKMALSSFGLEVKILNIHIGPNVTKYEIQPEQGTKVSKFSALSNDIAMALASNGVRIEAPIPGKACVGIEIANEETMMVGLREILASKVNKQNEKLQVGLGKDISGQAIFSQINKTPHLLVAGATGSGKSVCINGIIVSILMKASPEEVKLIMIDPKKVELTPYNGIPHLLTPVIVEPKKASLVLKQMVVEMETRYEMFADTNTRNIEGFNEKIKSSEYSYSKLPYIVVIVDELADLMMVAANEVETSIARLAQMARACGIHLIIATQRPSTDVITGLIKANIPSRIAFAVSSAIDSRTILDSGGAEKLLGRGDMLYSEAGSNVMQRIQGAFLSDAEIEKVVKYVIEQYPKEDIEYDPALENLEVKDPIDELDEFYDEICLDVIATQKASTAYIQRKYRVGYNRASRIMDQLEQNGIISANEGTKPRRVLKGANDDTSI